MIEFNVDGAILDVPVDLKIEFKKKNILFAFDNIELERTTSFNLPKTETNLRVFQFSNDFHRVGDAMRARVDAQLRIGVVTKIGYLYVSSYDYSSNMFSCIFVTGELLALKQLKELGKADELQFDGNDYVQYNVLTDPNLLTKPSFRVFRSYSNDDIYRPSYRLGYILEWLMGKTDLTIETMPDGLDVVITNPNQIQQTEFSITQQVTDPSQPSEGVIDQYYNSITASNNTNAIFEQYGYDEYNGEPTVVLGLQEYYRARFLRAKMDIKITFPNDFPDLFMYGMRDSYGGMVFYGDYSFSVANYNMTIIGSPLAGRTISLKKGDAFIFVDKDNYKMIPPSSAGGITIPQSLGFYPLISLNEISGMIVEADGDLQTGDIIYLRDNLPSLTAIDILKIFAYINGKVLWYNSATKTISLEDLDLTAYPIYELNKVVEVKTMTRTFGDYAQSSVLRYTSADGMRSADIIEKAYTISNLNLEREKELYKIPFSEGRRYGDSNLLLIHAGDNDTIAKPVTNWLYRTNILINSSLQNILTRSTTIDISAEMTLFEFDKIQDKVRIFYDNALWVWIDANWGKGIARFTLARV
jgi:hypothetical protein